MPAAPNRLIDLYSDTQTKPTAGMRKAMAEAEVGDEQRGEDPSTNALNERVADLLGKEAAVFLPSGTMCNQIAMLVHCRPGDEIIAADYSHIFTSEAGGGSALAGAQTWNIKSNRGIFSGADLASAIRDKTSYHTPRSRLVVVEQTNNRGGGKVWPLAALQEVSKVATAHGLLRHMDGARLLNAVVATGVPAKAFAATVDTTWLDLSKGLGCPVGGVLAGPKDFIREAWQWKHRIGGAMRQSGILAAAGLYALDHHVDRLAEDHANARLLADLVREIPGCRLDPPEVDTNLVFFDVEGTGLTAKEIVERTLAHGVRVGANSKWRIRAVTHHDVSRTDIEKAAAALRKTIVEAGGGAKPAVVKAKAGRR